MDLPMTLEQGGTGTQPVGDGAEKASLGLGFEGFKGKPARSFKPGDWVLHVTKGLGEVRRIPSVAGAEGVAVEVRFQGQTADATVACVELQPGKAPHAGELDHFQRLIQLGELAADSNYSPSKAKDGYYGRALKRVLSRPHDAAPALEDPSRSKPTQRKESKPRKLGHTRAMQCFDRCVEIQAKRERNSLRRRARLLMIAKALGLAACINRQEIAQRVLEAKQRATGEVFRPLTATDRAAMVKPVVRWLLPGLLPAGDLTIIGGRPKVGKTRLAVALVAAVLNGEAVLDLPAPASTAPVILVTDDQGDGDTADMLDAVGLWLHPGLTTSSNFRLTEDDLDRLLAAIKANPGALVVIDSLRSVSRAFQYGENDPEIGATLYDLKQAVIDAGGTLLLIHHCNKTADAVGLEALSGHSSIGGAANTVLTMHYLPGENGHPNKEAPERRLFREPRSGEGFDLVITRGAAGSFRKVSTLSQWQQQIKDAKEASKADRLNETQEEVFDALKAAAGDWMTRRQVCEAVAVEWTNRGRTPEAQRITRALTRLVALELVESQRAGVEATYRASHEAQNEVMTLMTVMPPSDANGSQCHHSSDDIDDSDATQSGTGRHHCHHSSDDSDAIEKPLHDREASVSSLSSPTTDPLRLVNEARIRELGQGAGLSGWTDEEVAELLVSLEKGAHRRAAAGGIEIPKAA